MVLPHGHKGADALTVRQVRHAVIVAMDVAEMCGTMDARKKAKNWTRPNVPEVKLPDVDDVPEEGALVPALAESLREAINAVRYHAQPLTGKYNPPRAEWLIDAQRLLKRVEARNA